MKNELIQKLLSPNLWVGVFSALAAVGVLCMVLGHFQDAPTLTRIGLWLVMLLIAGGIFLVIVVIPYLIVLNRRARKRQMLTGSSQTRQNRRRVNKS